MSTKPTDAWDETYPAGSTKINLGDDAQRQDKTQTREIMAADHKWESSGQDTDWGFHKQVTMIEAADIGTGAVGLTILGSQTVSGKGELVYTDEDDNDIQLTSSGYINPNAFKDNLYIVGTIDIWAGAIADIPSTHLLCDGSAVSRTTYSDLFTAIGTIHGVGDGSTTFNIPDLRDVSIVGAKEDDSGTPKTNISGSLTQDGGASTKDVSHTHTTGDHELTEAETGTHDHVIQKAAVAGGGTTEVIIPGSGTPVNTGDAGSGTAHNHGATDSGGSATQDVLNPYYVMTYIIRF